MLPEWSEMIRTICSFVRLKPGFTLNVVFLSIGCRSFNFGIDDIAQISFKLALAE